MLLVFKIFLKTRYHLINDMMNYASEGIHGQSVTKKERYAKVTIERDC